MAKLPEDFGKYYDSVPIKREVTGRTYDNYRNFSSSYDDYSYPKDQYRRDDYSANSRGDSNGSYDDRRYPYDYRRDDTREHRYRSEDDLSRKERKRSRENPKDSPKSSKSRHRSHSHRRHHGGSKRESGYNCKLEDGSDSTESNHDKIYPKNRKPISKVIPMPQKPSVKLEMEEEIEVIGVSNNKIRTQLRRINKKKGETEKVHEVVTLPSDSPTSNPSRTHSPYLESMIQDPLPPRISVVPSDQLGMTSVMKFDRDEELMIPEDDSQNFPENIPFHEPPLPAEPHYYRPPEPPVSYDQFQTIPQQNIAEMEQKPFSQFSYIPPVVQMEPAPIGEEEEQRYKINATCPNCDLRLCHECKYPGSTDPKRSSLDPGIMYTCQCSLIFFHTKSCHGNAGKVYVAPMKETGLIKQVDRAHDFQCHDCDFKFSLAGVKSGSHYFESLTRKDGQLREKGKRCMSELQPFLKRVDNISRQRYPNEPPSVQERHVEIRRCLICQCNQGCCIVYHDCPPKPSSDEQGDENL